VVVAREVIEKGRPDFVDAAHIRSAKGLNRIPFIPS
jgi:hypothetical protein